MEFGVQFFPDVKPEQKSGAQYFDEALVLTEEAERLGFTHIRIVEHYFHYYGGYSPNPMLFLAAAAQRTRRSRLVTGAVLPVFNHPLKLAGEIGMLDALSGGRLDVGFARAFLPHEFRRFGRSPDESVARFREGIEQVALLLTCENVTHRGRFHTIENTTALPRPTQKPRPKFYVAALNTPDSFTFAGRMGYSVMAIPLGGAVMRRGRGDAGLPHALRYRRRACPRICLPVYRRLSSFASRGRLRLARRPHLPGLSRLRQSHREIAAIVRRGPDFVGRGVDRLAR